MNKYYLTIEKGLNYEAVIGMGESLEDAIREPLDNGYAFDEIETKEIDEKTYRHYLDMYT